MAEKSNRNSPGGRQSSAAGSGGWLGGACQTGGPPVPFPYSEGGSCLEAGPPDAARTPQQPFAASEPAMEYLIPQYLVCGMLACSAAVQADCRKGFGNMSYRQDALTWLFPDFTLSSAEGLSGNQTARGRLQRVCSTSCSGALPFRNVTEENVPAEGQAACGEAGCPCSA